MEEEKLLFFLSKITEMYSIHSHCIHVKSVLNKVVVAVELKVVAWFERKATITGTILNIYKKYQLTATKFISIRM